MHWLICPISCQSRKEGKNQESIQSSTTPDPGYCMGKWKYTLRKSHIQESQEVSLVKLALLGYQHNMGMYYKCSSILFFVCLNPLYTNGFFLLAWYNKLGIVHCTYLGVSSYNLQKICILLFGDLFYLYKQRRPWWNAALCGILSASSQSATVPVCGLKELKVLNCSQLTYFQLIWLYLCSNMVCYWNS